MIAVPLVIIISNLSQEYDLYLNDSENITYIKKQINASLVLKFVGKVLSEEGLKISRTKIQSVLNFPLPTVGKQLKSFLGTMNYLRDFVRNHSTIVKPLHDLIANYDKTRKIVWTPETTAVFHETRLQVRKCSTMHFLSDTAPITLRTDASDYGVGGYLFQLMV